MQVQDEGTRAAWLPRPCAFETLTPCSGLVVDGLCEGHGLEIFEIAMR